MMVMVWKMFFKYDRDRSGMLEKDEVYQAIGSLGEKGRWKGQRERGEEMEGRKMGRWGEGRGRVDYSRCIANSMLHFFLSPSPPPSRSQKAMTILFNCFAKRRQYMNLDDFCSCMSRVRIMNGEEGGRRGEEGERGRER